jgi:hypothetical protein
MIQPQVKYVLVVLLIVIGFSKANSQAERNSPCPDDKAYTGRYRNVAYGFSIVIPAELKGYWNSARCVPDESVGCVCMQDHGRSIPLSNDAFMEAYVGYQNDPDGTVVAEEREVIFFLKHDEKRQPVRVVRSRWFRLGSLHARRFKAQYLEDNKPMVTDHIVALHDGIEYELILVTTQERYRADRRQFETIIASWRLTPRE